MSKKQLYIVRTQIDPIFLDPTYRKEHLFETREQQVGLVSKINNRLDKEGYDSFSPPFLGLLEEGRYAIPVGFQLCAYGIIKNNISESSFGHEERQLTEFIDGLVQGRIADAPIFCKETSAVVEFSANPILETYVTSEGAKVIDELAKKYEIIDLSVN